MRRFFAVIVFTITLLGQQSAPNTQPPPPRQPIPTPVLYRGFFRHVQFLEDEAAISGKRFKEDSAQLRAYYQKEIGLVAPQAAVVKQVAATNVAAVRQLDDRAQQIIRETRARHPDGRLAKGESPPSPPPELAELEQQRDQVTRAHIENLKAALGTNAFKQLDDYLQTRFARNFSAVSPNGSKAATVPRPAFPAPSIPKTTQKESAQ